MKKILLLLFISLLLNAVENKVGYPLHNVDIKKKVYTDSKKLKELEYKEEILIIDVIYDKNNDYWYKTKYGFVFGASVTTDVRNVKADLLHIRIKPNLQGTKISYFLEGDNVIVIQEVSKADGYNWVFTTEGYVASNYLTSSLIKNKKIANNILFMEKPIISSKILKKIKFDKVKFVVQKATLIDLNKPNYVIEKEQNVAIKQNKQRIKLKNITLKKKKITSQIPKIIKKQITKQTIKKKKKIIPIKKEPLNISLNSFIFKLGKTNNNYSQTNNIGTKPSKTGSFISIQSDITINYLPKKYMLYSAYTQISYTMREKQNLIFGIKKIFNYNNSLTTYLQAGVGISFLKWTKDPLSNSTLSLENSNSSLYEIGFGGSYLLSKTLSLEIFINQSFQNHTTNLKFGGQNSTMDDKSTLKYGLGLRYNF